MKCSDNCQMNVSLVLKMQRFGVSSSGEIDIEIENLTPENTTKLHNYVWKQFTVFCEHRNYKFQSDMSNEEVADIMKDWAFNMQTERNIKKVQ